MPLMVRGPGLEPGRTQAMTTAPDLAPTIMELTGLGGVPTTMTGGLLRRRPRREQAGAQAARGQFLAAVPGGG